MHIRSARIQQPLFHQFFIGRRVLVLGSWLRLGWLRLGWLRPSCIEGRVVPSVSIAALAAVQSRDDSDCEPDSIRHIPPDPLRCRSGGTRILTTASRKNGSERKRPALTFFLAQS